MLCVVACDDVWRHYTGGVSGQSFLVDGRFAILNNGYRRGAVTWVVVRDWPGSSTPAERLADTRCVLGNDGVWRVRGVNGALTATAADTAYIFYDDQVRTFPIRMVEDDFIDLRTERLQKYADVEAFLRRFEHR